MPATIVGRAKGRAITAFTTDLPRKSSRTKTQAVSVPSTAFVSAAAAETASVSFNAATASALETASQKPAPPLFVEVHTRAAMGSATISDRKAVTKPRERAVEALSLAYLRIRGPATAAAAALAASWAPHLLL